MIAELVHRVWDVIVIGAGMGGGLAGRRLAESGASVLFVDRGPRHARREAPERFIDLDLPENRLERGYWPDRVEGVIDGRSTSFFASLGAGIGGTSLFYAAMLERPEPHDLDDLPGQQHPTGGWPVGYGELGPYFHEAETLLEVCGEPDPLAVGRASGLRRPPTQSGRDRALADELRGKGLHPYRKHVGVRYLPGCVECFGRICPRPCKMDGRTSGVEPALRTGRAAIIDRCEVTALRGSARRVTVVEAERDGVRMCLQGRQILLAAGALSSPRLLLASACEQWPAGCGNDSGLVGRNLMFHLNERFAFWPRHRSPDATGGISALSLRDFYQRDGTRFGHVHSMGISADYGSILQLLRYRFDTSRFEKLRVLRPLLRVPAAAAGPLLGNAQVFVGLLEDMPSPENRVVLDGSKPRLVRFEYRVSNELLQRRRAFRTWLRRSLGRSRTVFLNHEPELNMAHSCGTLRFGADPATSVLDARCRSHAIENLWVADASFMPTSNGVNPSLTIAANALRVADRLLEAHGEGIAPSVRQAG